MQRKVKFLKDNVDLDLDVAVTEENAIEMVEVIDEGIMFMRWVERNKEEMGYVIPFSEERIHFNFID